jgi:hypothetical protein
LTQELAPRGIVEKLFVADIANLVWEMRRLRRSKTAILDMASKYAVQRILRVHAPGFDVEPKTVGEAWLSDAVAREDVIEHLKVSGLDESAIEAETLRRALDPEWEYGVEMLDRITASLEMRFRKTLRAIADYRETFANQARMVSNRLIEVTPLIPLEKRRTKKAG